MKSKFSLIVFSSFFVLLLGSMVITSCTKEGPQGLAGEDGKDGTETCTSCHNFSEDLLAKMDQHANSAHASGANINRSNEGCSQCHTSMGFRTFVAEGKMSTVHNPTAINCRTCHPIHETYTADDYQLRTTSAVTLLLSGSSYNHGSSNLCVNCHQSRPVNPLPVVGGPDVNITNARWSPHYATQANIFGGAGKGGYEIPGSMPYMNSGHTAAVKDGCVTCHMSSPVGYLAGGHQMNIKYGTSSYNLSSCGTCHTTDAAARTATLGNNRTEIKGLLTELETLILAQGLMNPNGMFTASAAAPKTLTSKQAGAVLNYKLIYYDNSYGAHNYPYTKALLVNSIAALTPDV